MGAVLARCPRSFAGHTCSIMNWAVGFRELGWDVWLVEHVDSSELEPSEGEGLKSPQEEFWFETAKEFGFENRQCLIVNGESPDLAAFRDFASSADLFVNYSGQFKRLDLLGPGVKKAYLDVDPAFTQLWAEVYKSDMNFEGHDIFLTVGTTLDHPEALIPSCGRDWIPVAPPVVGDHWRQRLGTLPSNAEGAWTTIAHWYGYPDLEWQGRTYGGKRESLMAMRLLPTLVKAPCAIATDMKSDWHDYDSFMEGKWGLQSAPQVCSSIPVYLQYIASSRGEIGIAKAGYVTSRGGWVSDRSVVYLAMGCPVVLQDTGWTKALPTSAGLLPFTDVEDCAQIINRIEDDYANQSKAARELADTVFSARKILGGLVEKLF
jgi:hypothetical protein